MVYTCGSTWILYPTLNQQLQNRPSWQSGTPGGGLAVGPGELGPYVADLLNNDTQLPATRVGCGKKRDESSA